MDALTQEIRTSDERNDRSTVSGMVTSQRNYEACKRMLCIVAELDKKMMERVA